MMMMMMMTKKKQTVLYKVPCSCHFGHPATDEDAAWGPHIVSGANSAMSLFRNGGSNRVLMNKDVCSSLCIPSLDYSGTMGLF